MKVVRVAEKALSDHFRDKILLGDEEILLTGLILRCGFSATTPYQTFKEPRMSVLTGLSPISLAGSESGLESHPYWTNAYYQLRSYFASEIIAFSGDAFPYLRIQIRSFGNA